MARRHVSIDRFHGGISPSRKEGPRGGSRYVRSMDIHEEPSTLQLLPGTSKDSGSTVTGLVVDSCRVPNGDTYFIDEDKKFYKRTSGGTWSVIGTISGDTNGMGMYYWPAKDTIYITTDTSISTYGRISASPSLEQNKYADFIDQQIDVDGDAEYPAQTNINGWWKMEEEASNGSTDTDNPSGDTSVNCEKGGSSWDAVHDETGTTGVSIDSGITVGSVRISSDQYRIHRGFLPFDTSAIPDGATIISAKLRVYVSSKNNDDNDGDDWINVVQTSQATDTSIVKDDYDQCGAINDPTEGATRIDIGSISTGAYNEFTLDSTGLSWIDTTGNTLLGLREGHDALDNPIASNGSNTINIQTSGDANPPELVITYGGADRVDSSGNGNTLTDNNGAASSTDSKEGSRSVDFEADDSDQLSITDGEQTGLDFTSDFSIALWVKPESQPSSSIYPMVSKWRAIGDEKAYRLYYEDASGTKRLALDLSSDGSTTTSLNVNQTLSNDTWYHVAVTYDASAGEVDFYVESSKVGSTQSPAPNSINNSSADFAIGANQGSFFDGLIDDVIVWNTKLDSDEIGNAKDASTGGYNLSTSISENAADKFLFTPDNDPQSSVVIPINDKGTGDWTVTVHDDSDNTIATSTVTNANLTSSADNTFSFADPWRPVLGAQYHCHITSTVSDGSVTAGSDAIDTKADRLITPKSKAHPILEYYSFIVIGDGRYLRKYDGLFDAATDPDGTKTPSWETGLTLASGYEITCLAQYDEYIVMGCEYRGDNLEDFASGLLVFWDGTSEQPNSFIEIEEGGVQNILPSKNLLYFVAGLRGELFAFAGDEYKKLKRWPDTSYANYVRTYHSSSTVFQGMPLFGMAKDTDNGSFQQGVWAYGAKEGAYSPAFSHDYVISTGTVTGTSLSIGAVAAYGTDLFIAWKDGSTYGVDIVEPGNNPASTGIYEAMTFDNQEPHKDKKVFGVKVMHKPLPSGGGVKISYDVDRSGSWTDGTADNGYNTTDNTTETVFWFDKFFKELDVKITEEATSDSPEIYSIAYDIDDRSETSKVLSDA